MSYTDSPPIKMRDPAKDDEGYCPFCGNTITVILQFYDRGVRYSCTCTKCGAHVIDTSNEKAALYLWATRAENVTNNDCPFCGGTESDIAYYDDSDYCAIMCSTCKAVGPAKTTFKAADKAWKRRI